MLINHLIADEAIATRGVIQQYFVLNKLGLDHSQRYKNNIDAKKLKIVYNGTYYYTEIVRWS